MNKRKNLNLRVSILGSTGSIGTQALEVIDDLKGIKNIHVVGISGNKNIRPVSYTHLDVYKRQISKLSEWRSYV